MAESNVHHDATLADPKKANLPPDYTPGEYSHHPEPSNLIVVQPTVAPTAVPVVVDIGLGPNPARVTCKYCNTKIVTKVKSKHKICTHLFAAVLCFGGLCCCAFAPYMGEKNGDHYCPNCKAFLGSHRES